MPIEIAVASTPEGNVGYRARRPYLTGVWHDAQFFQLQCCR
jgi:hypothetical protein